MIAYIIIGINVLLSALCFQNTAWLDRLILHPFIMKDKPSSFYRFISSGFIHANWQHLLFNMFTLFFFGPMMASVLGPIHFLSLYFGALIVSDLPTYFKYKNNPNYRSLGASGAVVAVTFAFIYIKPWESLYIFFAIPIPAIVFAILYLLYSMKMSRDAKNHINHDAHFYGAVFGLLYMLLLVDPSHGRYFIDELMQFPKLFS